jgi:uncharacterized membrane protein YgdD (TMEM256/DUF423 family)
MSADRFFVVVGSVCACLAVALGAFAAHDLKTHIAPESLATFETGVRYQMYHALALLSAGFAYGRWPGRVVIASGCLFLLGIVLFSGSLYALSFGAMRRLGAVTPLGGIAFLAGWLCLAWAAWRR